MSEDESRPNSQVKRSKSKVKTGKSWKQNTDESEENGAKSGLKINIQPTDVIDGATLGKMSPSKLSKDGADPTSPRRQGTIKREGEEDEEVESPSRIKDKREMDKILLTAETKKIKEKLLDLVDDLVVRQNKITPNMNMETFSTETSSRRVLKELLSEFSTTANDLTTKFITVQDQTKGVKQKVENLDVIVKSMKESIKFTKEFEKRVTKLENTTQTFKDQIEKNYSTTKDHLNNTKEMLLQKFDVISKLEDLIKGIKDENAKNKEMNDAFQKRVDENLIGQEKTITQFMSKLQDHIKSTHDKVQKNKSLVNGQVNNIRDLHTKLEMFNEEIQSKFAQNKVDVDLRCTQDDMKQNFQKMNELLQVKFQQVEDCKQTCRQIIVYEKFYNPILMQQIISENFMKLEVTQKDKDFMIFQREQFERMSTTIQDQVYANENIEDVDLREHLDLLLSKNIRQDQGDWTPLPPTMISKGFDFISPIVDGYLTDLRIRKKEEMFGEKCDSFFLRRGVKMGEIDKMVESTQDRVIRLSKQAKQLELKLIEEERQREIAKNIKQMVNYKIQYKNGAETQKRRMSFKGRLQNLLFTPGIEQEEVDFAVQRGKPTRPKSRVDDRGNKLRQVTQENTINWNNGFDPNAVHDGMNKTQDFDSQMNSTMNEIGKGKKGDKSGAQTSGTGAPMTEGVVQKVDMSNDQKRAFIGEIKVELRDMINSIAAHHTEEQKKATHSKIDDNDKRNTQDHLDMQEKFEREMLIVSNYCKAQTKKVQSDFKDEIRSMQKLRARDRSDYDVILNTMKAHIKENRADIDNHSTYFNTFAQSIALLTENINMQMESEYSDIYDRNLMALYGNKEEQPSFMDHTTRKKDVMHYLKAPGKAAGPMLGEDQRTPMANLDEEGVNFSVQKSHNEVYVEDDYEGDGDGFEGESQPEQPEQPVIKTQVNGYHDPVRETSGRHLVKKVLPLTLDQNCINHSSSNHDRHITLKLFKSACLAYKPSKVLYRDLKLERNTMVKMRRSLIDMVIKILPSCHIFKENAFYPRKYFDDLMLQEKSSVDNLIALNSTNQSNMHLYQSKADLLRTNGGSTTKFESTTAGQQTKQDFRSLGHSPTERVTFDNTRSKLILPNLSNNLTKQKFIFGGLNDKNLDNISDIQIGDQNLNKEILESDLGGYQKKGRKRGIHAHMMQGTFDATGIKRNSVLNFGHQNASHDTNPKMFKSPNTTKNSFHRRNHSTIDGKIQKSQMLQLDGKQSLQIAFNDPFSPGGSGAPSQQMLNTTRKVNPGILMNAGKK